MNPDSQNPQASWVETGLPASMCEADARAVFIRRTYSHVAFSLAVMAVLLGMLIRSGVAEWFAGIALGTQYSWLLVLGAFMLVSTIADRWARSDASSGTQYLGLGLYIGAVSLIFSPLMLYATEFAPDAILQAAVLTGSLVAGITGVVFMTRKDFSFLGPIVGMSMMIALGVIVCAILFGFSLGTVFAAVMVVVIGAGLLYQTSNVLHHYRPDQHVAAALALFASIAIMFWYVLQIILSRR